MNNPILQDFLKMRANLKKAEAEKKVVKGIADLPAQDMATTLAGIIENKPGKKEVDEYFKKRCEQLGDD